MRHSDNLTIESIICMRTMRLPAGLLPAFVSSRQLSTNRDIEHLHYVDDLASWKYVVQSQRLRLVAGDRISLLSKGHAHILNVRSMSTESRGRSRTNKLIAVPPLSAKSFSRPTIGSNCSSSDT